MIANVATDVLGVVLAGISAVVWGTSDFCGGLAVQHSGSSDSGQAVRVTVLSHLWGIPVVLLCLLVVPGQCSTTALLWGAGAGVAGIVAVAMLYQALGDGMMALVAPLAAVTAAAVPVVGGLATGERPATSALSGVLLAMLAISLLAAGSAEPASPHRAATRKVVRNLLLALGAGLASGCFYLLLGQADASAGTWPLVSEAAVSIAIGLILLRRLGTTVAAPKLTLVLACLAGLFDTLASGIYLLATQHGQLSLVAPVAALDPASTVVLAYVISGERLKPIQFAGVVLALMALILTAS